MAGIKVPSENLMLEGVQITYRNFAGAAGQFNPAGVRTFAVKLFDLEQAQAIEALGWKVKYSKPRQDGSDPEFPAYLPVTVKYHPKLAPPRVVMLTSRGQTKMDEESIDILDFMNIKSCDMILRPYHWSGQIGEGVKNMCSSIYITILEDALELKYADVPMVEAGEAQKAIGGNYQSPFDGEIEDLGEIPDPESQYALEQGQGF